MVFASYILFLTWSFSYISRHFNRVCNTCHLGRLLIVTKLTAGGILGAYIFTSCEFLLRANGFLQQVIKNCSPHSRLSVHVFARQQGKESVFLYHFVQCGVAAVGYALDDAGNGRAECRQNTSNRTSRSSPL